MKLIRRPFILFAIAASSAMPQGPSEPTDTLLRFDVNLVQVDAVVTDRKGRHVSNLTPEDFVVLDNGKRQRLTHFSYESKAAGNSENGRQSIVFLLDDQSIAFPDFVYATQALDKYVANMAESVVLPATEKPAQNGRRVERAPRRAAVSLPVSGRASPPFALKEPALAGPGMELATERKAGSSPRLGSRIAPLCAIVRTSGGPGVMQQFSSDPAYLHSVLSQMVWHPPIPSRLTSPFYFVQQCIYALHDLPGRKSVVWISPGLQSDPHQVDGYMERKIVDLANRSAVTIETIDVRGLPASFAAGPVPDASQPAPGGVARFSPSPSLYPETASLAGYYQAQAALIDSADMTGGLFLHESNDLLSEIQSAVSDADGFYLLGWYPEADAFSIKPGSLPPYRRIQIKLDRRDLSVRSRNGYVAMTESQSRARYFSPQAIMQDALFSPLRERGIQVELASVFDRTPATGPVIHSVLHVGPRGLVFDATESDGCADASLEIAAAPVPLSWDFDGNLPVEWRRATVHFCKAARAVAEEEGLAIAVDTMVPAPGAYQMRIAVRNLRKKESATSIGLDSLVRRDSPVPSDILRTGEADQVIAVPDWNAQTSVAGLYIRAGEEPPLTMGEKIAIGLGENGSEAVRHFRLGQQLTYGFRLLQGGRERAAQVRLHVLREGKEVSVFPVAANSESFTGTLALGASAPPGHYLLGVEVVTQKKKTKAPSSPEWVSFDVS